MGVQNNQLKQQLSESQAQIKALQAQQMAQAAARPGTIIQAQTDYERRAGVNAPNYEGTRDVTTGELLAQYRLDPYSGAAQQALKEQAFAQGDSPWAQAMFNKQKFEQSGAMDTAAKQGLQAMSQAQAGLARMGGLSAGARQRMAMQGARDLMLAKQGISREGIGQRLGIQQQDIGRKEALLKDFANAETGAQQSNIGQLTSDLTRKAAFDANRYNQQMQAWGAEKSAQAQAAASRGGGKK